MGCIDRLWTLHNTKKWRLLIRRTYIVFECDIVITFDHGWYLMNSHLNWMSSWTSSWASVCCAPNLEPAYQRGEWDTTIFYSHVYQSSYTSIHGHCYWTGEFLQMSTVSCTSGEAAATEPHVKDPFLSRVDQVRNEMCAVSPPRVPTGGGFDTAEVNIHC